MYQNLSRLLRTAALTLIVSTLWPATMRAQGNYRVIFNFGEHPADGYQPWSGVLLDSRGNIYGNTEQGGQRGFGTVYQLIRDDGDHLHYSSLHSFDYYDPGNAPVTGMVRDNNNRLYGTNTTQLFELLPTGSLVWQLLPIHQFTGGSDGDCQDLCSVSMDSSGNLWGSTPAGGQYEQGVVFVDNSAGHTVVHDFTGGDDGGYGVGQLAFDNQGNIYGTAEQGGMYGQGVVYRISPNGDSWTYTVLHHFSGAPDGSGPWGGVILGNDGNLYGTTSNGGSAFGQGGTVFRLNPNGDGTWSESVLYSFSQDGDGFDPVAVPTIDADGNLYGTTLCGIEPQCNGTIYKLTQSDGQWTENIIHAFQGAPDDGATPFFVKIAIDNAGNLYGTTTQGGSYLPVGGIVWEYTP
jgi:uncharacterized repeat protein (TIGR03803 family)